MQGHVNPTCPLCCYELQGAVRQCRVNSASYCGLPNYKGPAHEAEHVPHKEDVGTATDVWLIEEQFYLLDPRGCASVNWEFGAMHCLSIVSFFIHVSLQRIDTGPADYWCGISWCSDLATLPTPETIQRRIKGRFVKDNRKVCGKKQSRYKGGTIRSFIGGSGGKPREKPPSI
jgi:hypothetical protein